MDDGKTRPLFVAAPLARPPFRRDEVGSGAYDGSVVELPESSVVAAPSADARAAVHALTRASRILERSLPELSLADFRVLSAVAEGEGRASRLAQRLALGKPAISSTVDSLVRRGLLRREAHDSDQRAVELVLTPTGDDVRRASENALAEVVTALAAGTDDPGALLASLAALGEAIERRQASFAAERMGAGAMTAPATSAPEAAR